jgi:ribosomal RNA-processing protein 12
MTQDLLLLLLPFFPSVDSLALFELCISPQVLEDKHTDVQKRGYKTLGKLIESGKVTLDAETVIRQLESAADSLTAAAKKVGLFFLQLFPTHCSCHIVGSASSSHSSC